MKAPLYFLIFAFIFSFSCKKNTAGGKAEVKGRILHHAKTIGNAIVYVKYDAKEFPGTDYRQYDTYVKADASGRYTFKCFKGDYFLYATGIDSLPEATSVNGGVPVHVRSKEVVEADIAVSEVH